MNLLTMSDEARIFEADTWFEEEVENKDRARVANVAKKMKQWKNDPDVGPRIKGHCRRPGCNSTRKMVFHHVDELMALYGPKTSTISKLLERAYTEENKLLLLTELKKCIKICGTHHALAHPEKHKRGTPVKV